MPLASTRIEPSALSARAIVPPSTAGGASDAATDGASVGAAAEGAALAPPPLQAATMNTKGRLARASRRLMVDMVGCVSSKVGRDTHRYVTARPAGFSRCA